MGNEYAIICSENTYPALLQRLYEHLSHMQSEAPITFDGKNITMITPILPKYPTWIGMRIDISVAKNMSYLLPDGTPYIYCYFGGGDERPYLRVIEQALKAHGGACVIEDH